MINGMRYVKILYNYCVDVCVTMYRNNQIQFEDVQPIEVNC